MHYYDNLLVKSIIRTCEAVGKMFLAQFIGIDSFWMGVYLLAVLIGVAASVMIPGGKKHVR